MFQPKLNSYENICWVSAWTYISSKVSKKSDFEWKHLLGLSLKLSKFWVSSKTEYLWRHFLSFSLKLSKFTSFKQKRSLMKTFLESQFEVMSVYEFQAKANSFEDICWASVWSHVILWVSNKSEFWWRHLLSLSLKLSKFISFKQKPILMNKFTVSHFELM